jgi:hypothetical protein
MWLECITLKINREISIAKFITIISRRAQDPLKYNGILTLQRTSPAIELLARNFRAA